MSTSTVVNENVVEIVNNPLFNLNDTGWLSSFNLEKSGNITTEKE